MVVTVGGSVPFVSLLLSSEDGSTSVGDSVPFVSLLLSTSVDNPFADGSCVAVSRTSLGENWSVVGVRNGASVVSSLWDGIWVVGITPSFSFCSFDRSSREGVTGFDLTLGSASTPFLESQLERKSSYGEWPEKKPNMIPRHITLH